jgi:SPP1 gp7 family putative phage head morphogenesis protein
LKDEVRAGRAPAEVGPLIEGLRQSIMEAMWTGYSGQPLDYTDAVDAMRKNPLFGVDLKNVLSWGKREAMSAAAESLQYVRDAVGGQIETAVTEGTTLAEFASKIGEITKGAGLAAPDPWHTETIFRTNTLAAYSGGEWARAKELEESGDVVAAMYVAIIDDRTRPTHAAMDEHWARLDDEVWTRWWPPAGWNCRCFMLLLTQEEVDRLGGWGSAPTAPAVSPDPGFEGNPGTGLWQIVGKHMH